VRDINVPPTKELFKYTQVKAHWAGLIQLEQTTHRPTGAVIQSTARIRILSDLDQSWTANKAQGRCGAGTPVSMPFDVIGFDPSMLPFCLCAVIEEAYGSFQGRLVERRRCGGQDAGRKFSVDFCEKGWQRLRLAG